MFEKTALRGMLLLPDREVHPIGPKAVRFMPGGE